MAQAMHRIIDRPELVHYSTAAMHAGKAAPPVLHAYVVRKVQSSCTADVMFSKINLKNLLNYSFMHMLPYIHVHMLLNACTYFVL